MVNVFPLTKTPTKPKRSSGFSLIELMITLGIAAIAVAIGAPSLDTAIKNNNMTAYTNATIGAFAYARFEAVKRGNTVTLGPQDGSSWASGMAVWFDTDGDGSLDAGEELRIWDPFPDSHTVTSSNNRSSYSFSASGEVDNDDELTICDDRTGETGRMISVFSSGLVVSDEVTCA